MGRYNHSGIEFNFVTRRGQLKCDGTRQNFVFRRNGRVHLNRRGASVQSTTGSRGVRISGSNAGYTMFPGSVKSTGYPLHSPVSPSLPFPCVTVCRHISAGLYMALHAFTCTVQPVWPCIAVRKAACVGVAVIPKNKITISVRGSGSCAIIRLTAVGVCCILSVWN